MPILIEQDVSVERRGGQWLGEALLDTPEVDRPPSPGDWDEGQIEGLVHELEALCSALIDLEKRQADLLGRLPETQRASARNLLHYLALRRHDIRQLQERLARLGLSSLGRAESHVLSTLSVILKVLYQLSGRSRKLPAPVSPAVGFDEGVELLDAHTEELLGPEPAERAVRIMVTMPSEAAEDYLLVRELLDRGMNCMRINCAHDDATDWARMVANLRRAEQDLGKSCRILMDLAGPKLRTGPIEPGPRLVKWRPRRDLLGRVTAPARIWLVPDGRELLPPSAADACLPVPEGWLAGLEVGDHIKFTDTRGASRRLEVVTAVGEGRWAESNQTAYVAPGTRLRLARSRKAGRCSGKSHGRAAVGDLPPIKDQALILNVGDTLTLTREMTPGRPATSDGRGRLLTPATIGCTLPAVFECARPHERVWLDDGKIGGVIALVTADQIHVEITRARAGGAKLGADKGINLPDSDLKLSHLTDKDLADLPFIAAHADMIGYSFVREPAGVAELRSRLEPLNGGKLGLVLKIETRTAFQRLPELLLEAMRGPSVGVMIARGDLAIECGYERLAEVQEEILWVCESAHVPVIWATQVLENLAKEGQPSRAEITDAAMGQRAECVMLNKGPHIREAVVVLDDILRRMQPHQTKKRSLLRQLRLAGSFS
jgi:pyruvate kinase